MKWPKCPTYNSKKEKKKKKEKEKEPSFDNKMK